MHSEVLESVLGDNKIPVGASPGQPVLADTLCREHDGWTRWFLELPAKLIHSLIL